MGLLDRVDGYIESANLPASQLEAAGCQRCYTNDWKKRPDANGIKQNVRCPFWLTPQTIAMVQNQMGGYYTCPVCQRSYDIMHHMAWHGVDPNEAEANQRQDARAAGWGAGGGTKIGLTMVEQAQIGESLVHNLGNLGQYGPITWWHDGGAAANSPLDGATQDWGIEVKTIGYDAMHHRFVPGGKRKRNDGSFLDEKAEKNQHAVDMGKKGVLGVLVLLDYRRSVADIYVRAYPTQEGVKAFRSSSGEHLFKSIPFANPLSDPHSPAPHVQTGLSPFAQDDGMPF